MSCLSSARPLKQREMGISTGSAECEGLIISKYFCIEFLR